MKPEFGKALQWRLDLSFNVLRFLGVVAARFCWFQKRLWASTAGHLQLPPFNSFEAVTGNLCSFKRREGKTIIIDIITIQEQSCSQSTNVYSLSRFCFLSIVSPFE